MEIIIWCVIVLELDSHGFDDCGLLLDNKCSIYSCCVICHIDADLVFGAIVIN